MKGLELTPSQKGSWHNPHSTQNPVKTCNRLLAEITRNHFSPVKKKPRISAGLMMAANVLFGSLASALKT
jgi:hypothetical protein